MVRAVVEFGDRTTDWSRLEGPHDVTVLVQVHGSAVVVVDAPGAGSGQEADAAVTAVPGARLLIRTADCAPVAFVGMAQGRVVAVGAAHAGWKGLRDGVLGATVEALLGLGATHVTAYLGPCIEAACYEFGDGDLATVVHALGPEVRGRTAAGTPALDMVAGVRASLAGHDVHVDTSAWQCTACAGDRWFSHRARRDTGRQGMLVSMVTS